MISDLYTPSDILTWEERKQLQHLDAYHLSQTAAERWALENCIFPAFDNSDIEYLRINEKAREVVDCIGSPDSATAYVERLGATTSPRLCEGRCEKGQSCERSTLETSSQRTRTLLCAAIFLPSRTVIPNGQAQKPTPTSTHCESFRIRNLDGTLRSNRVPDHVLDQAIAAAYVAGCKLIWIIQDCSPSLSCPNPQNDRNLLEAENWNVMFQLSHQTAALLSVKIERPEELEVLCYLLVNGNSMNGLNESRRSEIFYHVSYLFERIWTR
ncbi:hypothetical protein CSAL01_02666 [Colletotrichum salicis]|uniref:Heterokaryon incompatibility domain-containing protein n=1 Tax=Colletotrichum salicis TaxID=1209931 RepID=A0A135SKA6_9PEZI|nr:hypothetical protein CSAL01_02666 [Colletotrichum salicis]